MGTGSSPMGGGGMNIDPREADSFFGSEWDNSLSTAEKVAVFDYAGDAYKAINPALWNSGGNLSRISDSLTTSSGENVKKEINDIDSALAKGILKQNIVVYRGDRGDIFQNADAASINRMKGRTFQNMGYSSASITQDSAVQQRYMYRIVVPKGRGRGAFIRNQSPHYTEHEYLIKRNAKYKIKGATEQGKQIIVDLEMLP